MTSFRPSLMGSGIEQDSYRLFGVYPALVTKLFDKDHPENKGKIEIELPWTVEDDVSRARGWARLATFMAGSERGSWFIPEVHDEVLISFVAGDPRWPIVLGSLWNGVDIPPESMDAAGNNNIRSITSRSGHHFTFDDTSGEEKIEVVTQAGHVLNLNDAKRGEITLRHSGGTEIKIDATGTISITALNQVNVDAPAGMKISTAMLTVNAAMSNFSGVVKAETVITNAVVSSSYTPGAGNVW